MTRVGPENDTHGSPETPRPQDGLLGGLEDKVLGLRRRALVFLTTVFAIVFSEIVASAVSLVMTGRVPPVIVVAAFITPAVVAPTASLLLAAVVGHLRREIHDRRRAEEDLLTAKTNAEIANRIKSEFLANISHELRTPLNAIIGFSDIMRQELRGPLESPHYRGYVRDIHAGAKHLLEVINDILDVGKVEAGRVDLNNSEVEVWSVVGSAVRIVRDRAREGGVTIVCDSSAHVPKLLADERRVKQMLLNLLSNAVKFTPEGGRVVITAEENGGGLAIKVADSGIGIAADDLPLLFTPFTQLDGKLSRKYEGTGLGLSLTKGLVELHGGSVGIESAPGQGTTVTLNFPPDRVVGPSALSAARA
jgi:signal transduction histidine kinase